MVRAVAQELAAAALARWLVALPAPALRALGGRPPAVASPLAPDAWLLARLTRVAERPRGEIPLPALRAGFEARARPFSLGPDGPVAVEDHALPGRAGPIPARLAVPAGAAPRGPLVVWFHGGGWVQGSIATHDRSCRRLADLAGVRVLSVGYRLAPEHPFPAAVQDAFDAYAHVAAHPRAFGTDAARLALGGDSAGGNLAAVVARLARDAAIPPPAFQLLLYPGCDAAGKAPSRTTFASGFFLTEQSIDFYLDAYLPDRAQRSDPRASPLLAGDLAGIAPAYLATCTPDPLRDEGEAYAARLREAGVAVAHQRHPLLHGWFNMTAMRSARAALAVAAGALRQGLAG